MKCLICNELTYQKNGICVVCSDKKFTSSESKRVIKKLVKEIIRLRKEIERLKLRQKPRINVDMPKSRH